MNFFNKKLKQRETIENAIFGVDATGEAVFEFNEKQLMELVAEYIADDMDKELASTLDMLKGINANAKANLMSSLKNISYEFRLLAYIVMAYECRNYNNAYATALEKEYYFKREAGSSSAEFAITSLFTHFNRFNTSKKSLRSSTTLMRNIIASQEAIA